MLDHELFKKIEESNLEGTETKPLYISKISINGDNINSPLSSSSYKAILDQALSRPLQNVGSSLYTFGDIRRKLLCTGLYQEVKITLENDVDISSQDYLREKVPRELGIELPLATHAKIMLTPSAVYDSTAATTSLFDDAASLAISRSCMNLLGRADSEFIHVGLNYDPKTSNWEGKSLKGSLSLPLNKNPSVRANINVDAVKLDMRSKPYVNYDDRHDLYQYSLSAGLQKRWIMEQAAAVPTLYAGISSSNRCLDGFGPKASEALTTYSGNFNKTALEMKFHNDTRKYFGAFPISGYELLIRNDYVISQSDASHQTLSPEKNFSKFNFGLEHHSSHFNNKLVNTLDLQIGALIPFGDDKGNIHPLDKWYLGGLESLKGFKTNSVGLRGSNYYYKLGLTSSQKLIKTPLDSPLRLQLFINMGNTFNELESLKNSCAAATGVSLAYKTPQANVDLTYALPITSRLQDITKPGISFGVTFSYF